MILDKKIWQEALAHYREWNNAKLIDQVMSAGKKTPEGEYNIQRFSNKSQVFFDIYSNRSDTILKVNRKIKNFSND